MKRILRRMFWFLAALSISSAVYFTIRYGLRPKPVPVMNATQFENPEQIGAVVYRRLRQEARGERLILLGSDPTWPQAEQVWSGFLKTAAADQLPIDVLYSRAGTSALEPLGTWAKKTFSNSEVQSGALSRAVQADLEAGKMVLVSDSTPQVTHLLDSSFARMLEQLAHHPVLALSTLTLSLQPEEIENLKSECLQANADFEGWAHIHCSEARVSKLLLKKKPTREQMWSIIERHGLKEYLIFVKPPVLGGE
jgi:hypothetical protein